MAYKRVYAPTGEPFDVPETRSNELILQNGWTQQPPVMDKEKPRRTRSRPKFEEPKVSSAQESSED